MALLMDCVYDGTDLIMAIPLREIKAKKELAKKDTTLDKSRKLTNKI